MLSTDEEYRQFEVELVNDGTMDIVITVNPLNDYAIDKAGRQEFRWTFDGDEVFYFDEDGRLTDKGFKELAEAAMCMYIDQYLMD
jgi:hypothetical protein